MTAKACIKCGISLTGDTTTWYRQKNYIHKCNDCIRAKKREQAKNIPADVLNFRSKKYNKKLKENDPVKYTCRQMSASAKKRAKALGLDCGVSTDFLISIAPTKCPVFNVELKYGGGEKTKWSPSLDKIDPLKGYTKDNVQIVSNLANLMMSEASMDEQIMFAEWVLGSWEKSRGLTK